MSSLLQRSLLLNSNKYLCLKTLSSFSKYENQRKTYENRVPLFPIVLAALCGCCLIEDVRKKFRVLAKEATPGEFLEGLPTYSMEEVSKHTTEATRIWVVYREGVYDVTDFVKHHPGGEQILIAAGASVEPFWVLYAVHKNEHVFKILESLRIGNLDKNDTVTVTDLENPYGKEPKRHVALKTVNSQPFNAETPISLLCENFITPNDLFYVRNHLPVPDVNLKDYALEIETNDKLVGKFTLDQLKQDFPTVSIVATLMCAGNRRSDMTKIKAVKGLNWGPCAIGTATWTGVRLRDVLKRVGIKEDEFKHVHFEGIDYDVTGSQYGTSIPIWKAMDKRGDVILAYEMNGVSLPLDHGYPLRVVVPGVAGARNVKWLGKIIISNEESQSHWQQNDYKGFSPSIDYDTADFTKAPPIQEMPVISAICQPTHGDVVTVMNDRIRVKGYAWSGGGQKIIRVDVSVDQGKTWYVADFTAQDTAEPPRHWAWTLWSLDIPVGDNQEVEIWCKAVDSSYNTQPENFQNIWNFRGVLSNAYHKVRVQLSR